MTGYTKVQTEAFITDLLLAHRKQTDFDQTVSRLACTLQQYNELQE